MGFLALVVLDVLVIQGTQSGLTGLAGQGRSEEGCAGAAAAPVEGGAGEFRASITL